jgi:hypothetical protein
MELDNKKIVLLQFSVLVLALWVRWPLVETSWQHDDEWAFIVYPLGFWSGDFNPHFFNYPTLQFYVNSALYYLHYALYSVEPLEEFIAYHYFVDDSNLLVIARAVSMWFAVATIALTIALGRRLYGVWGGVLAGFLLAVLPLHSRFSHLAITDIPASFWTTAALLFAVRVVQEARVSDLLVASICAGLAGATKYPAGLVLVPVLVGEFMRSPTLANLRLYWAAASALCAFGLASPYVLLDFAAFWTDLSAMGRDHLLNEQLHETSSFVYLWLHNLRYGLGVVPLLAVFCALLLKPRLWRREELVLLIALLVFVALLVAAESRFMRYALPLAPLLAILIVRPFLCWRPRNTALLVAVLLLLLVEPVHTTLNTRALLIAHDTRMEFKQWLYSAWPNGGRLVFEPPGIGYRPLLNVANLYVRQNRYINSFGEDGLMGALALLSKRTDLPPLSHYWSWQRMSPFVAETIDSTVDTMIVVYHDHPQSAPQPKALLADPLVATIAWQESWEPGSFRDAVFDWQDAYYVPVEGRNDIVRAGPAIQVGYVPLKAHLAAFPTAREFFVLVHRVLQARKHIEEKEWAAAIESYESAMQTPFFTREFLSAFHYYDALEDLGYAYANRSDFKRALYYWKKALELRPGRAVLYSHIGLLYREMNERETALNFWHKALELDKNQPDYLLLIGLCYMEMGQFTEGINYLERCIAARGHVDDYIALGQAYGIAGRFDEQRVSYANALKLSPDHEQADQIRQLMRKNQP